MDYTQSDQFTGIKRKFVLEFSCQAIGDVFFHVKLFIFLVSICFFPLYFCKKTKGGI